jgi:hypothetical protein
VSAAFGALYRRRSRLFTRVALVGLGLCVPILVLEILLAVAGPILPGDYQTAAFTASSATSGLQNRPYAAGYKRTSEFSVHVRVNSKGLRGPEIDHRKPPGTFRAIVLGDSFTFALQVEEDDTFVNRLGERLEQTTGADVVFETINGGADGWTTVNEYVWLTTEGYRYEPDLIVLMFYAGNDPGENADRVLAVAPGGRVLPRETQSSRWQDVRLAMSERSHLYNILEFGVLAKLQSKFDAPGSKDEQERLRDPSEDRKERGWEISEDLLALLRDYCARREIGLMIVGIPALIKVTKDEPDPSPLADMGRRIGVSTVDLLDPFRQAAPEQRTSLYFPKNQHWTAEGHQMAARIVAAELRLRGQVPGRSYSQPATHRRCPRPGHHNRGARRLRPGHHGCP